MVPRDFFRFGQLTARGSGDAFTVTAAALAITDLAGNTMTAPVTSSAANAVIFGTFSRLAICLTSFARQRCACRFLRTRGRFTNQRRAGVDAEQQRNHLRQP